MTLRERVSMISLGCAKNLVDTEVMLGLLIESGYQISEREEEAEIIIINTCGFIEVAKEESIDTILESAELKKTGNCRTLVVTGCLPQRYEDALVKELSEVDIFIGTGEFHKVVEILDRFRMSEDPPRSYIGEPRFLYNHKTPRLNTCADYSAYVKIAEGCSNSCSYCVIGRIRGRFRSRVQNSIIEEVENLVAMGVKEINLIAQDTTMFGRDIKSAANFEGLLRELARIDGLQWIRVLYTHPAHFTEGLIKAIKEEEAVCNYIDLPIQHINDKILEAMGRKTKGSHIRRLIERLRREIPDISIRTSLIVGFPGETDDQFGELLEFMQDIEFERLGAFKYSKEEGTMAATFPNQVPEETKEERYHRVMEVQKGIAVKLNRGLVGTTTKVLIEGLSDDNGGVGGQPALLKGRTPCQAPDIDGITYITKGKAIPGEMHDLLITGVNAYDLIGEIVSIP